MVGGKYYAFKRIRELGLTTSFTYILQLWLALFAFSAFMSIEIGQVIWGWWLMLDMSPLQWVLYVIVSIIVLFFALMGIWAFLSALIGFCKGWRGQVIRYDPNTVLPEVLRAIKPIESKKDLREYRNILRKLIEENNELTGEYKSVIKQMEAKSGSEHKQG